MKNLYRGRTQRIAFTLFFIGFILLLFARAFILVKLFDIESMDDYESMSSDTESLYLITMLLSWIFILFLFSIPVVRRFHDMNKGGENFFFMLIPLLNIFYLFRLIFEKGSYGANKYGPDPDNPSSVYIPPDKTEQTNNGSKLITPIPKKMVKCIKCGDEFDFEYVKTDEKSFICLSCQTENTI